MRRSRYIQHKNPGAKKKDGKSIFLGWYFKVEKILWVKENSRRQMRERKVK